MMNNYQTLKVLSSDMDLAYVGLILEVFIKGRGAEFLSEFRPPPPSLWEPFKVTPPPRTVIGN